MLKQKCRSLEPFAVCLPTTSNYKSREVVKQQGISLGISNTLKAIFGFWEGVIRKRQPRPSILAAIQPQQPREVRESFSPPHCIDFASSTASKISRVFGIVYQPNTRKGATRHAYTHRLAALIQASETKPPRQDSRTFQQYGPVWFYAQNMEELSTQRTCLKASSELKSSSRRGSRDVRPGGMEGKKLESPVVTGTSYWNRCQSIAIWTDESGMLFTMSARERRSSSASATLSSLLIHRSLTTTTKETKDTAPILTMKQSLIYTLFVATATAAPSRPVAPRGIAQEGLAQGGFGGAIGGNGGVGGTSGGRPGGGQGGGGGLGGAVGGNGGVTGFKRGVSGPWDDFGRIGGKIGARGVAEETSTEGGIGRVGGNVGPRGVADDASTERRIIGPFGGRVGARGIAEEASTEGGIGRVGGNVGPRGIADDASTERRIIGPFGGRVGARGIAEEASTDGGIGRVGDRVRPWGIGRVGGNVGPRGIAEEASTQGGFGGGLGGGAGGNYGIGGVKRGMADDGDGEENKEETADWDENGSPGNDVFRRQDNEADEGF
ncbi:hypothetical protein L249_2890 [Ophiocordyceps polyrhachis-furcata BCC 54312]|uniref:Uncharacterized protein n=1 Tax=Ophiocordyceps polyrhachis-furcata BCC 54312 TaxID=1330021 RepID=A0A367LSH7_9HYPO|nr:hypothetical protein L249_2890 [Ophiocordyceps polyrhachis-furcata BCC 54312]